MPYQQNWDKIRQATLKNNLISNEVSDHCISMVGNLFGVKTVSEL